MVVRCGGCLVAARWVWFGLDVAYGWLIALRVLVLCVSVFLLVFALLRWVDVCVFGVLFNFVCWVVLLLVPAVTLGCVRMLLFGWCWVCGSFVVDWFAQCGLGFCGIYCVGWWLRLLWCCCVIWIMFCYLVGLWVPVVVWLLGFLSVCYSWCLSTVVTGVVDLYRLIDCGFIVVWFDAVVGGGGCDLVFINVACG